MNANILLDAQNIIEVFTYEMPVAMYGSIIPHEFLIRRESVSSGIKSCNKFVNVLNGKILYDANELTSL